jgi:hypothetical protein
MTATTEIYQIQAETFFPLQLLQLQNIHIHPPAQNSSTFTPQYSTRLPISSISYKDSHMSMPKLGILTHFLKIHNWDGAIGRLDLELETESIHTTKLQELQSLCIQYLQSHPELSQAKEDTPVRFQSFFNFPILTVFLSCSDTSTLKTHIYNPAILNWEQVHSNYSFQKGQQVRLALRCQGLLCIPIQGGGVRFRLQHTVPALYMRAT